MESRFVPRRCSLRLLLRKDRISSLPDELLLIILSFLKAKEMVKTSVLSTRWFNLWINSHVLDFQLPNSCYSGRASEQMECKDYVESVNLVLLRHKSHYLKKFKTAFFLNDVYKREIDTWLEFALARKVEVLELNFLRSDVVPSSLNNYVFPDRHLKLELTCLKSLSLKNVNVAGEAINFILLNCPFLERLELVGNWKLVNLVISDPTLVLKHLQIKWCFNLKVLRISNINLVLLDSCAEDLILSDLPLLVELSLAGIRNSLHRLFSQLGSYLPQLEVLTLEAEEVVEFTYLPNVAQLKKLKRLVIDVGAFSDESLTMLCDLMTSCQSLEEFVLVLTWDDVKWSKRIMREAERFGISSSLSSLKVFEFDGYFGRVSDFELIVYVVKNAPNLEKIIIRAHNVILRSHNCPLDINEKEARSFALKQIGALRKSEFIPPHVDVVIC